MGGILGSSLCSQAFLVKLFYEEDIPHGFVMAVDLELEKPQEWEGKGAPFWGLDDLLLQIDSICDIKNIPKRDLPLGGVGGEANINLFKTENSPKRYMFISLSVLYRCNASLQGILNIERHKISFRSAFELMKLLQEDIVMRRK